MSRLTLFVILSIPIIILSRRTLLNVRCHGFYRFFAWECIIWLFISNYKFWFKNPFVIYQIISWIFLLISGYLVIAGALLMKQLGKSVTSRNDRTLYKFEKTSILVDRGIFKYIRHPLYSSLIFLTWGILFKNLTSELLFVAVASSIFLYLTALFEEKECLEYFGKKYRDYMKHTKRFIPYLL